jgi:hypothetical protein
MAEELVSNLQLMVGDLVSIPQPLVGELEKTN